MMYNKANIEYFINLKRKGEATGFITILFCIAIIIILNFFVFQLYVTNAEIEKTSDALVAANLSTYKNIDFKTLARNSQDIIITDDVSAFSTFIKHLGKNLFLDSNEIPIRNSYIKSKVKVENFIIYNVLGDDIFILTYLPYSDNFTMEIKMGQKGLMKTPKGTIVSCTTIHSSISFDVGILFEKRNITLSEDTDIINTN